MARAFTNPIIMGSGKFVANRENPRQAETHCNAPAKVTTSGTNMILEAPTVSVLISRDISKADRPDALEIIPGRPPMTAVITHEIQHDCKANEGGRPAMTAKEIASGIMQIDTVGRNNMKKGQHEISLWIIIKMELDSLNSTHR
jgi:hypothetical protein